MKTLLEHNQSAYTTIAILEGVDGFKLIMKVKNIFKGNMLVDTIRPQQGTNGFAYLLRGSGIDISHFVGKTFVITHGKP